MLMRALPLLGGLLLSRGGRKLAGRNAGKLALALGAWELWRTYQRSRTPAPTVQNDSGKAGTGPFRHNRRRRHPR